MKIKNQLQKQQEKEFPKNLSFAEWLEYFKITPINNTHYHPLKGA